MKQILNSVFSFRIMKGKLILVSALLVISLVQVNAQQRRSNPIVSHMFTADPSAHVWEDGRLYVYPSTDLTPSKGYRTMDGYHVFSSDDMSTWVDHGEILHSDQVPWGRKDGGFMWAPDCAYRNGMYYFYFPHRSGEGRETWKIGVATSTSPTSGFQVQGYIKGVKALIDPCVFIDDDGQAYLFIGGEGDPTGYKLKENMLEIDGGPHSIKGLDKFREGLWMFKRKGLYYIIYPDNFPKRNKMRYAISDHPLGPFRDNEVFLGSTDVITMHGSVVEYKGQWYVFYHNGYLSGGIPTNRSICFDPIFFNEDGTIQMVEQSLGVELPTFYKEINFNGYMAALEVGDYAQNDLLENKLGNKTISSIQIPKGYKVQCYEEDNFKGKTWFFEEDRIDLKAIACNRPFASIRVFKSDIINLVKNPSFELTTQGQIKNWGKRGSVPFTSLMEKTDFGYYVLQYKGNKAPKELTQQVKLIAHTDYQLSVMMRMDKGTTGKVIFDMNNSFDETCKFELEDKGTAGQWVEFKSVFNSGESTDFQLRCRTSDDFNGVCYWDHVVLKMK